MIRFIQKLCHAQRLATCLFFSIILYLSNQSTYANQAPHLNFTEEELNRIVEEALDRALQDRERQRVRDQFQQQLRQRSAQTVGERLQEHMARFSHYAQRLEKAALADIFSPTEYVKILLEAARNYAFPKKLDRNELAKALFVTKRYLLSSTEKLSRADEKLAFLSMPKIWMDYPHIKELVTPSLENLLANTLLSVFSKNGIKEITIIEKFSAGSPQANLIAALDKYKANSGNLPVNMLSSFLARITHGYKGWESVVYFQSKIESNVNQIGPYYGLVVPSLRLSTIFMQIGELDLASAVNRVIMSIDPNVGEALVSHQMGNYGPHYRQKDMAEFKSHSERAMNPGEVASELDFEASVFGAYFDTIQAAPYGDHYFSARYASRKISEIFGVDDFITGPVANEFDKSFEKQLIDEFNQYAAGGRASYPSIEKNRKSCKVGCATDFVENIAGGQVTMVGAAYTAVYSGGTLTGPAALAFAGGALAIMVYAPAKAYLCESGCDKEAENDRATAQEAENRAQAKLTNEQEKEKDQERKEEIKKRKQQQHDNQNARTPAEREEHKKKQQEDCSKSVSKCEVPPGVSSKLETGPSAPSHPDKGNSTPVNPDDDIYGDEPSVDPFAVPEILTLIKTVGDPREVFAPRTGVVTINFNKGDMDPPHSDIDSWVSSCSPRCVNEILIDYSSSSGAGVMDPPRDDLQ